MEDVYLGREGSIAGTCMGECQTHDEAGWLMGIRELGEVHCLTLNIPAVEPIPAGCGSLARSDVMMTNHLRTGWEMYSRDGVNITRTRRVIDEEPYTASVTSNCNTDQRI